MSHRPARINPDTLPVLIVAALLAAGLAAASFALTFAALLDVAAWANVAPRLAWAVPVMLDAAIVVYTLAVLVRRARHEPARFEWAALAAFTTVSVVANAAHAGGVPPVVASVVGTVVAGLAPVAVLLATHTLARLIVAPPDVEPEPAPAEDADDALQRWANDPRLYRAPLDRVPRRIPDARHRARELRAQGMTYTEVAAALGRPRSTVHAWIKEAS